MTEIYNYLLRFMLNCAKTEAELLPLIGYTNKEEEFSQYKVVIVPSDFFPKMYGKPKSMPKYPLKTINNVPILYGEPEVEKREDGIIIVRADLVASAYFLISRYEEWIYPQGRDEHGRMQGKESVMDEFLHRPVVDEYGKLLRQWLRDAGEKVSEPPRRIKRVCLTHDVDVLSRYRSLRGLGGALWRSIRYRKNEITPALKSFFGGVKYDPVFSFPWILEQNEKLKAALRKTRVETIIFVKSGKYKNIYDQPYYNLNSRDVKKLFQLIHESSSTIGLHTSYTSGEMALLSLAENEALEKAFGYPVRRNRNHYLRAIDPIDMPCLSFAGITDDYTMGYADMAGFRLGTCRTVKWINPKTKKMTNLTLHPLTVMDCTLYSPKYMNMDFELCLDYCKELIDNVREHFGELVLLWHNDTFAENGDFNHKELYTKVLEYIKKTHV